jgi:serine/threonine protein kinase
MTEEAHSQADLLAAGDLVASRYRVSGLLGRGGMGEVYTAEDLVDGEQVALKLIHPELLGSDKARSRFEREVEWTRKIDHPNVLKIREFLKVDPPQGAAGSVPCVVMELLQGRTLADHLGERQQPMSCAEARPIVCQVAAALAAAHRSGIVHRDLKPDNIFLVPTGMGALRVVLTDFGVARTDRGKNLGEDSQSFTASNVLIGTPDYMAPEQLELEKASPISDLYSLGLVFYEMVTGQLPFVARNKLEAVFLRVKQPAPSPRLLVPDIDEDCERVIVRCLKRDPIDRYSKAQEIIRELDGDQSGWLRREPLIARRSLPTIAIGIAVVVVVLIAVWLVAR